MPPTLSVVVPVHGCAGSLPELVERLRSTVAALPYELEIVLVDDGSPDAAWEVMGGLEAGPSSLRCLRLSRNFGQHAAITAGLAEATGDLVVVMDCDLQDPPELIAKLTAVADEGAEVVLARRMNRPVSVLRSQLNRAYFWLLGRATGAHLDASYGTFSLLRRNVVDAFLSLGDVERHYLFILNWLGFRTAEVTYTPDERDHGTSSYTWRRLLRHALSGLFFQTAALLRWIVLVGFGVAGSGGVFALVLAIRYWLWGAAEGWTSLAVLMLVLSGVTIASTGVAALYVGRIYEQVKQRPLYVVAERIGSERAAR